MQDDAYEEFECDEDPTWSPEDQPLLREIYNKPLIISYKRAKSLGDILVRAKL